MGFVNVKKIEGLDCMEYVREKYNMWSKTRGGKQGGGVMLLVRKDLAVEEVVYGKFVSEMVILRVIQSKGKK